MSEIELKTCPFCDSNARLQRRDNPLSKWKWSVDCRTCGMSGPVEATSHEASEAWNRRTGSLVEGLLSPHPDVLPPVADIGPYEQMLRDAVEPFLDWLEQRESGACIQEVRDGLIGVEDVIPDSHVVLGAHLRADADEEITVGHFRRLRDAYEGKPALALPLPVQEPVANTHEERISLAKALSWDITEISPDDVKGILAELAKSGFRLAPLSPSPSIPEEKGGTADSMVGWMPIETAPKDGTPILAFDNGWLEPEITRWSESESAWCSGSWCWNTSPALWQPLPSSPSEKGGTAESVVVDIDAEIASTVQSVNEWDDRTSPDDYPDHLLITSEELALILRNFAAALSPSPGKGIAESVVNPFLPTEDGEFNGNTHKEPQS